LSTLHADPHTPPALQRLRLRPKVGWQLFANSLTQFWMYASPVIYPSERIPAQWRAVYGLNPMAGVIDGFRWALLGSASPPLRMIVVSIISVTAMLIGGLFYFRRMEKTFADLV
jgi:lipopolysaccharide transport system permease protein